MPFPLIPLAVSAGIAGIGAYGRYRAGRRRFEDSPYDRPADEFMDVYRDLSDPTFGLEHFRQLAVDATPTADTFLRVQAAQGGSSVIAQEQVEAARRAAHEQAFRSFGAFQLETQSLRQDALRGFYDNERFNRSLFEARQQERREFWNSVLDQGLGIGATSLGQYSAARQFGYGGGATRPAFSDAYMAGMWDAGVGRRLPMPNRGPHMDPYRMPAVYPRTSGTYTPNYY